MLNEKCIKKKLMLGCVCVCGCENELVNFGWFWFSWRMMITWIRGTKRLKRVRENLIKERWTAISCGHLKKIIKENRHQLIRMATTNIPICWPLRVVYLEVVQQLTRLEVLRRPIVVEVVRLKRALSQHCAALLMELYYGLVVCAIHLNNSHR